MQLTMRVWRSGNSALTVSTVKCRVVGLGSCSVRSSPVRTPKLYTSIFVV
ncbi:hypothetical protein GBAR_LOCUS12802, partial [Geodia barretti]